MVSVGCNTESVTQKIVKNHWRNLTSMIPSAVLGVHCLPQHPWLQALFFPAASCIWSSSQLLPWFPHGHRELTLDWEWAWPQAGSASASSVPTSGYHFPDCPEMRFARVFGWPRLADDPLPNVFGPLLNNHVGAQWWNVPPALASLQWACCVTGRSPWNPWFSLRGPVLLFANIATASWTLVITTMMAITAIASSQCWHKLGNVRNVLWALPHFFLTTTLHDEHFWQNLPFNGSHAILSTHCMPDIC